MKNFDHKEIERKWQARWEETGLYKTMDDPTKETCYVLDMFPYPSGAGLHVGHPKGYIATDVYSRFKRMNGFNILHPMGWDAFGLPAENYALKNKVHPGVAVQENVARFKEQLQKIGFNYDWDREINTTDPAYYHWTQWIFVQLFKKGLAYESYAPINWCPSCKTGLANEDLDGNACERCGTIVEKKPMRQWVLRITEYADRLLSDLDTLPWPDSVKEMQRNWIGRSEGALIRFQVSGRSEEVEVFTTRADTLYGATYVVLAPEHPYVEAWKEILENWDEVDAYRKATATKTDIERTAATEKEKTGVLLKGVTVINPANGETFPVYVADYVLASYGTGAIMAVPAHDERDHAFATAYNLPIREVVKGASASGELYTGEGELVNSGAFSGMQSSDARRAITQKVGGKEVVRYRLQDWVFSRQRYWGEPIPIIHCTTCGAVPVPEAELPVKLPDVESYEPTGTGESPLAVIDSWVNTTCPSCKAPAKRETNTMPQWAGSSWYYLRYIDPHNTKALVDKEKEARWSPVDVYVGGLEHATRHLIYARFWHKFLFDIGTVSTTEPFEKLYTVGLILAEDGRKMSKRWGNVINPDDVVGRMGADALRVYEMFMGPFGQAIAWSTDHMVGARRFLERVYCLRELVAEGGEENALALHQTIRKVTEDIDSFTFNTAISQLMILVNDMEKRTSLAQREYETLLTLLAPFAPHLTEELWEGLGHDTSVHPAHWPVYDPVIIAQAEVTIAVQVNGKLRGTFTMSPEATQEELLVSARALPTVAVHLEGKTMVREIVVPKRLVSFVVK
jgi:leucyl-tRNA synthetase